ncbi:hypothetical protein Tco_1336874 [Tanacetum coccineum]
MPLSNKTILDSHCFVHELKTEMHDDLEYVKSLEKEIDELESEKADFSNIYDLLLEECVKECECLAQKLSKQTESVNKEVHNNLLKSFSKLEKHSISLELALQQCKEQMKKTPVVQRNGYNVFRKERDQYHKIQYLKAQMQDKNITISDLKNLIENCKGKSVETQFNKPSVVRQPNAQRIPKPSVLGKPTPFSNSPEMRKSLSLKFNDLQCPTCKKCLYTANHDECVLEYLSKLNPRASAQNKDAKSHNTTKRYVPFEKISESKETRKTDSPKDIEHPSDTNVFTMKMEILLEPASNKLLVMSNNGDTVLDEKLNRGNIYGQNEFEWVAFKTNKSPMKSPVDEYDLVVVDLMRENNIALNVLVEPLRVAMFFFKKVPRGVNIVNIFDSGMGPKEIDHIGGGVAATKFGVVRVKYPKEESYSRFQGLFGIAYWNKGCLGLLAEIVTYKGVVLDCISKC